ncbi:MAG: carboxymuconolactone decarboxylase family protein [Candidatus Thorarchaeota archaeon]
MNKKKSRQAIREISKNNWLSLDKPRLSPINEIDFVKELCQFHNAADQLSISKRQDFISEWETELYILVQWLKNYNKNFIDNLSSFLKLEEKGLDINSIKFEDFKEEIKSFILQEGHIFNIRATMTRYRKLRLKWILMASHVTYNSSLPQRDKEILILRTAWLNGAEYEWNHHVLAGKQAGISNKEIERIKLSPESQGWSHFDKILLSAVDELCKNSLLSDLTWKSLSERYDMNQLMDVVFVVGSYNMLAMFMNSFGLQTEDCVKRRLNES